MIIQTAKPVPKRREYDFYATPRAFCDQALKLLTDEMTGLHWREVIQPPPAYRILDPGCGTGVWGQAALARWPFAIVDGAEIRNIAKPAGYRYLYGGDFRLMDHGLDYDLIIGNPPYLYTEAFIRVGMANLVENGGMLYLLPLRFLEGKRRARDLFKRYPPRVVWSVGRVSFSGDKKTNATAYALYYWQKGWQGDTLLKWMV